MPKTRNYYLAQPCFILTLEKAFGLSQSTYTVEELAPYYQIWWDGHELGKYSEATKNAEGS